MLGPLPTMPPLLPGGMMRLDPRHRTTIHEKCHTCSRTCWTTCPFYNEGPRRQNCIHPPGKTVRRAARES